MATRTEIVGYIRLSKVGNALKMTIMKSALDKARTVESRDGTEYVSLIMNLDNIRDIIGGGREVASVCELVEEQG